MFKVKRLDPDNPSEYDEPVEYKVKARDDQLMGKEKPTGSNNIWISPTEGVYGFAQNHIKTIPAGCYKCVSSPSEIYLEHQEMKHDELIELPEPAFQEILQAFKRFWELEEAFSQHNFLYKRGILLLGPPGCGKTCLVDLMVKHAIEKYNCIVVIGTDTNVYLVQNILHAIKKVEPNRKLVFVLEDIDSIIKHQNEASLLQVLDGTTQVDNMVTLATTNYPEMLPSRIINRPSRFDVVITMSTMSEQSRKLYFKTKFPNLSEEEILKFSNTVHDLPISFFKEAILLVKCYGYSFDETRRRLKAMHEAKYSSSDFSGSSIGF